MDIGIVLNRTILPVVFLSRMFPNGAVHSLFDGARKLEDATLMESASTFRMKLELAS